MHASYSAYEINGNGPGNVAWQAYDTWIKSVKGHGETMLLRHGGDDIRRGVELSWDGEKGTWYAAYLCYY